MTNHPTFACVYLGISRTENSTVSPIVDSCTHVIVSAMHCMNNLRAADVFSAQSRNYGRRKSYDLFVGSAETRGMLLCWVSTEQRAMPIRYRRWTTEPIAESSNQISTREIVLGFPTLDILVARQALVTERTAQVEMQ